MIVHAAVVERKSRVRGQIFRNHLFQAVFVRTTYPSRYVYFRRSRVHAVFETAVTATVVTREGCKSRVQLEASEIGEIQAPLTHERRVLSRLDLHQVKDLFLYVLKILNDGVTSLSDLEL